MIQTKFRCAIYILFMAMAVSCNTEKTKTDTSGPDYNEAEKMEIARLAAYNDDRYGTVFPFSSGKAVVYFDDAASTVGVIGLNGWIKKIPDLKSMEPFAGNWAVAVTRKDIPCYVDTSGQIIHQFPEYQTVYAFDKNGIAPFFHKNGSFGLIDKSFKEIIPAKYNQTSFWKEGLFVVETGGKWGAVDKNDQTIIPFEYTSLSLPDDAGFITAQKGKMTGFIDKKGKELIPFNENLILSFVENFALYWNKQSNGKFGFINRQGKKVLEPSYDKIYDFSNGLAIAYNNTEVPGQNSNTKMGYIDTTGKTVIPNMYSSLTDFSKEGYALASDSSHYFYIDKKGKKAFPQLDTLQIKQMEGFSKGFANIVMATGESIYMDRFGNLLYPADLIRLREKFFH